MPPLATILDLCRRSRRYLLTCRRNHIPATGFTWTSLLLNSLSIGRPSTVCRGWCSTCDPAQQRMIDTTVLSTTINCIQKLVISFVRVASTANNCVPNIDSCTLSAKECQSHLAQQVLHNTRRSHSISRGKTHNQVIGFYNDTPDRPHKHGVGLL